MPIGSITTGPVPVSEEAVVPQVTLFPVIVVAPAVPIVIFSNQVAPFPSPVIVIGPVVEVTEDA